MNTPDQRERQLQEAAYKEVYRYFKNFPLDWVRNLTKQRLTPTSCGPEPGGFPVVDNLLPRVESNPHSAQLYNHSAAKRVWPQLP